LELKPGRKQGGDEVKTIWLILILFLFSLTLSISSSFSQEVRYKKFSSEEVKKMSEQQAIIHTPLGDITLKFFPEVAPNHVNNFIELAKKSFYNPGRGSQHKKP
jgi:peptidyl-prolyl cis-trans isomerase B (cyclophilin B)